jgi:predicted acetyltransferase
MPTLVAPHVRYEASVRAALEEFAAEGREEELGGLEHYAAFVSYVEALHALARGDGLPREWVAGSTFWLVEDDEFVGKVDVRHVLNDALRRRGGHVGYAIRPSMRRRGRGMSALTLVLPECVRLGLDRVLVTCDATNEASRMIIERNGGRLEDAVQAEGRDVPTLRYWIDAAAHCACP